MKNIILFVLFIMALVFFQFTTAQSVDDIINQYVNARGGMDKINAVQSIYLEGTREMMGSEVLVKVTKVEGKLLRTDFEFGGNAGYTIVTPEKGWTYIPMRSDKAAEVPANVLKSMQSQLDIAGPLVNYKRKGYTAELQGKENINGKDAYKIILKNSDSKEFTFFMDTKSNLLLQTRQMSEGGRNGAPQPEEIVTSYSDYMEVDGVKFPHTITTEGGGMGEGTMAFDKIEINISVDEKLYQPSN